MPHTQKVILITGTSSGFGLLFAARLAAQGHFVYATMRSPEKQQALLDEAARRGGQVLVRRMDVTKTSEVQGVVNELNKRHGHIDVVINNAGFGLGGFFEDLDEQEIREQMEVNFFGVQNVCRAVVPVMRATRRGLIINISSLAGRTASPCLGAYSASKWALEGFSEGLHYELAPYNVKVVLVEPGSYPTKIFTDNARYGRNTDNPDSPYYPYSQRLKHFVANYIRRTKKDPEQVAKLIERIVASKNPRLRYVSDLPSQLRIWISQLIPTRFFNYIYRKVIYGDLKPSV